MASLAELSLRLKELDKSIIKAIIESDANALANSCNAFIETKVAIKSELTRSAVFSLPQLEEQEGREILQRIIDEIPFPGEKAIKGTPFEELYGCELTDSEIEDLISDELYSWFSPKEYIKRLIRIGGLILPIEHIPENLSHFVSEAKYCYGFNLYNSVVALSRTILEICIKDLCVKFKLIPAPEDNLFVMDSDLNSLIGKLVDNRQELRSFKHMLHQVRRKGNSVVHGKVTADARHAEQVLKDTLRVVHLIYGRIAEYPNDKTEA